MNASLRKGRCPGALRPMPARDGLLVRLRITGGIVPAAKARAIADLAERHGSGLLDLTARANLQLRGVREAALPALQDGLAALGLLDADAGGEAVRNVLVSPMAGLGPQPSLLPPAGGGGPTQSGRMRGRPAFGTVVLSGEHPHPTPLCGATFSREREKEERPDIRPLVAALETALVADPALHALPAKFGFLVDDGGTPSLAGISADLRFDWDGEAFAVGLGGKAADALDLGRVGADGLVARALAVAHRLLAMPGAPRRPRALMRDHGGAAVAAWFGAREPEARARTEPPQIVGPRIFDGVPAYGLAAPFGRLDAAMLRAAADACADELRLTPWRTILLPHVAHASVPGFIAEPADPRLRVAACPGAAGCERGTTDTHADATRLARVAAALPGSGIALHVSGCAKGCAHPAKAPVTLVGRDGRYDVLHDGRPGDEADAHGLTPKDIEALLHRAKHPTKSEPPPHLPSPLWGGAGVGVPPCASNDRRSRRVAAPVAARHGLTPTPSPSPQGGGE